jgi:hypothetical protein
LHKFGIRIKRSDGLRVLNGLHRFKIHFESSNRHFFTRRYNLRDWSKSFRFLLLRGAQSGGERFIGRQFFQRLWRSQSYGITFLNRQEFLAQSAEIIL